MHFLIKSSQPFCELMFDILSDKNDDDQYLKYTGG